MSRTASGNCEEAAREERSLYMAVVCACAPTHSTLSAPRPFISKVDRSRFEVIGGLLFRIWLRSLC